MSILSSVFKNLALTQSKISLKVTKTVVIPLRQKNKGRFFTVVPKPGKGIPYRYRVKYPEEYTIEPLKTVNLGGRDPATGRVVVGTLGGGVKHDYHWVKYIRDGPSEGPPIEERVLDVIKCGRRSAFVALVACKDNLKYILATENMKAGDIIKTSKFIPMTPIHGNEGDSYPLGALAEGTVVHNIQLHPSVDNTVVRAAGCFAVIKKHLDDKVIVVLPKKKEKTFAKECMATVGRVSNVIHSSIPIGSAQKLRELGFRPRSGLWQKKTGRFGRKIRPMKPLLEYSPPKPKKEFIRCTLDKIRI